MQKHLQIAIVLRLLVIGNRFHHKGRKKYEVFVTTEVHGTSFTFKVNSGAQINMPVAVYDKIKKKNTTHQHCTKQRLFVLSTLTVYICSTSSFSIGGLSFLTAVGMLFFRMEYTRGFQLLQMALRSSSKRQQGLSSIPFKVLYIFDIFIHVCVELKNVSFILSLSNIVLTRGKPWCFI